MKPDAGTNQDSLPGEGGLFPVLLIFFAVTSLATTEFIKSAFPSFDALRPSKLIVVYVVFLVQVLPALALVGVDRLIAARYGSGRYLRIFRRVVFAIALVLILRQVQLYWDPATEFIDEVRSASVVLLAVLDLVLLGAIVALVTRAYRGVLTFFYYMSPIAIATTAIIAFQVRTDEANVPNYAQEVTTAAEADGPPVFILVFDGLGYDVLLEDGELDRESFPNMATLADSGASFSNATSNYFWSIDSVPTVVDPALRLTDEYNVRLYSQYNVLEGQYFDKCGETITCRGARYVTEGAPLRIASNMTLRAFYQAAPVTVESVIERPMGWFLDRAGWAFPSVDQPGFHTFTKRQFDTFLRDVDRDESSGRAHILHLLLPHDPNAFDADGDAQAKAIEGGLEGYRQMCMFADKLLGELIDRLKDQGLYEESVVIVTADHGPRVGVQPKRETPPADVTPRVPLIIHAPTLEEHGVVLDVDYQHIDFGETLADVLDLPAPADGRGVSAFTEQRPLREKTFENRGWRFAYNKDEGWHPIR